MRGTGGRDGSETADVTGGARKAWLAAGSCAVGVLISAILVEAWVRLRWDETKGRPGFYVSDPVLGQRLSPGYDGWFAGVPVKINALGFRDEREYDVKKAPGTFRILVLGDSVTFGHGTLNTTTYPYLLQQRLGAWRRDVHWQVWNLGVPGYATGQELAQLEQVAPAWAPDLVIVGFFPNDFTGNVVPQAGPVRRAASSAQRAMQRHLYSYEFYKRVALTLRYRWFTSASDRQRLDALAAEDALLARAERAADDPAQELTDADYFTDDEVNGYTCPGEPPPDPRGAADFRASLTHADREMAAWLEAVRGLQAIGRRGRPPVMFFINMAPKACVSQDRFYDAGELAMDDVLQEVLGDGVPVASSTRAFLHYRPSQMPLAGGHAIGNANRVKADALFDALSTRVLPDLLPK